MNESGCYTISEKIANLSFGNPVLFVCCVCKRVKWMWESRTAWVTPAKRILKLSWPDSSPHAWTQAEITHWRHPITAWISNSKEQTDVHYCNKVQAVPSYFLCLKYLEKLPIVRLMKYTTSINSIHLIVTNANCKSVESCAENCLDVFRRPLKTDLFL